MAMSVDRQRKIQKSINHRLIKISQDFQRIHQQIILISQIIIVMLHKMVLLGNLRHQHRHLESIYLNPRVIQLIIVIKYLN